MSAPEVALPGGGASDSIIVGADDDLAGLLGGSPSSSVDGAAADEGDVAIPDVVLAAYRNAARMAPTIAPGCQMDWAVLAGIGQVESHHGLHFGVDSVIDTQGTVARPIIGPALDGTGGVSSIADSDGGQWDADATWDRAVGPMQFIPSSWRRYGQDGNGDGMRDPHNVFDAALAAAAHLCGTAAVDLGDDTSLDRALYSYNHSEEYVATVRGWIDRYRTTDPADVPRVVVQADLPDGPMSPFPAPGDRLASVFDIGAPLFPAVSGGQATRSPSRPTIATRPVQKGPKVAAKDPKHSQGKASASKADPGKESKKPEKSNSPSTPSEGVAKAPAVEPTGTPSAAPSEAITETPSPAPPESATEEPSESGGDGPSGDAPATPSPETQLAPDPAPEPEPAPEPDPTPSPDPEPTPEPKPSGAPEPEPSPGPTAAPVDFAARPTISYLDGAAPDWPKACRPRALWASVVDDAVADQIVVATGVAQAAKGDALTVTWRTARDTVWRVTTHGCETGEVTQGSTSA